MIKRNRFSKRVMALILAATVMISAVPAGAAEFSSQEAAAVEDFSEVDSENAGDSSSDLQENTDGAADSENLEAGSDIESNSNAEADLQNETASQFETTDASKGETFGDDSQEETFTAAEETETFQDGSAEESAEGIQYIKGRPLTEEEKAEQLAPFENLTALTVPPSIDGNVSTVPYGMATSFPSKYDSRTKGIITSVKDQNPFGICWSFALASTMETSLLREGQGDYDLSEEHLAYFLSHRQNDPLKNTKGDANVHTGVDYHDGGNDFLASLFLSTWSGMTTEADVPLPTNDHWTETGAIPSSSKAYNTSAYLENAYFSDYSITRMKSMVKTYGSASMMYFATDAYYNPDTAAYSIPTANYGVNHVVTVVGWDDTYSKKNFNSASQVKSDGAWIVKNSWDTYWGDNGYFYLSYEDGSIDALVTTEAENYTNYPNNYFYDGSSGLNSFTFDGGDSIANVYTAKTGKDEILGEVVTISMSDSSKYKIQIYTNLTNPAKPTSGKAAYAVPFSVTQSMAGVKTISVPEVTITAGSTYAVVITNAGSAIEYACEASSDDGWIRYEASIAKNQGFWKNSSSSWIDLYNSGITPRIKAHTRVSGSTVTPKLTIGTTSLSLYTGKTGTMNATVTPGTIALGYSSSNPDVATVNSSGKITAVGPGTAVITCTTKDSTALSGTCKVTVKLKTPTGLTAAAKNYKTINLSWTATEGVNYSIRRQSAGESVKEVGTVLNGASTYTDATAKTGITYTYTVCPYMVVSGENVYGSESNSATAVTSLKVPVFEAKASASMYNSITWKKVYGVHGYRIYRKTVSGKWEVLATVDNTVFEYKDKTAVALTSYQYTVRGYRTVNGKACYSKYTTGKAIKTSAKKQTIASVKSESTGIRVRWTAQKECNGYRIYRKTPTGSWVTLKVISGGSTSSYLDKTAVKGKTYIYAVRAYVTEPYGRLYSKYKQSSSVKCKY